MADAEIIRLDSRTRTGRTGPSRAQARVRCRATTSTGRPCRNYATAGTGYCSVHSRAHNAHPSQGPETSKAPAHVGEVTAVSPGPVEARSGGIEEFIRHRLAGDYEVDDFGYDPELARQVLLPLAAPLYEHYFRVKTLGIDRIPDSGPALLVGNHSGTVAIDAVMVQYAVATEHAAERAVRNIGADLVYQLPFVGAMARKTGNAVATDEDAEELLRRGELVGV